MEKFDYIIVGSGAGGSTAAFRLSQAGKRILILEEGATPNETNKESIFSLTTRYYRNSGAVPFFGPFSFPFGEGRVLGGGTYVNGGLIWSTPKKVLQEWAKKMPESVFASTTWSNTEVRVKNDLKVNSVFNSENGANYDSELIHKAALKLRWKCVPAPRAVFNCKNFNRCAVGCPSGAKQSTLKNYLEWSKELGAQIRSGSKVTRIKKYKNKSGGFVNYKTNEGSFSVEFNKLILSAGATQSPLLLRKNHLSKNAGHALEFHLNFKIVANFREKINSENGTIFTHQIQEFEDSGLLIMASNFQIPYVVLSLNDLSRDDSKRYMENIENLGIYVVMTRPKIKAKVFRVFGQTFGTWKWDQSSEDQMRDGLIKLSKLLFEAGAKELVLPIQKTRPVLSLEEATNVINQSPASKFNGVSVHGMSGAKMGNSPKTSIVNLNCRVWEQEDIFVLDSSVLPSNMGESPQGTIMTMVHEVINRWQNLSIV